MQIFYSADIYTLDQSIEIEGQEHIHLTKVLRKTINDEVFLSNGKGQLYLGVISNVSKKKSAIVVSTLVEEQVSFSNLSLGVGLLKNNSRYEWMVEKSVEMGLNNLYPFYSSNSERKKIRIDRLEATALSAMKQSKQLFLPAIAELYKFKQFLDFQKELHFEKRLICYCNEEATDIKSHLDSDKKTLVLIGSEGGFLEEEVNLSMKYGFIPVTLGKQRLRTETAAIAVAALFNL